MTSGGVEPREDVVARADAALRRWEDTGHSAEALAPVVFSLIEEVKRLRTARYWVYLGAERDSGPFPSYEEADRERRHCIDGGTITARLNPQIYSIRTDGWEQQ